MKLNKLVPWKFKRSLPSRHTDIGRRDESILTSVSTLAMEDLNPKKLSNYNDSSIKDLSSVTVESFENITKVLESFDSILNTADSNADQEKVLFFQFELTDCFSESTSSQFSVVNSRCPNRSIVILLASRSDMNFSIFWKSKDITHFLTLKPYDSSYMQTNRALFQFIADFLIISLHNKHLGIRNDLVSKLESTEFELHFLADHREYNVVLVAAELGNADIVKTLLELGIETSSPFKNVNAQTVAYQNGHFDVLLILLQSNLPYPTSMDISQGSVPIHNFIQMCNGFHECIQTGNVIRVKEIAMQNPHLRYFYNESNESAAAASLRLSKTDIYAELMLNKIYFGPYEDTEEIMENLDYKTSRAIRELHFKHLKDLPENHINILMANSYVGHDVYNLQEKINHVQHAFNVLNSIPFIRIVLMVVAACRKFRIVFDFNRDTVHVVDPTSNAYTNGIFYVSGRIYIGARQLLKKETENEVLGTLAHELCHYALNLSFDNSAKPYKAKDRHRLEEFAKISEKSQNNCDKEEIVGRVYEEYPEKMHHAELAVRVPHLLAFYHDEPEKLAESQENFKELFDFVEKKVGPSMEKAIPDIEMGVDKEIKKKDKQISIWRKKFYAAVIIGILVAFGVKIYFTKKSFNELSPKQQAIVQNANVFYKNVTITLKDLIPVNSTSAYDLLQPGDISSLLDNKILSFNSDLNYLNNSVKFKWENLAVKLKEIFLNSNLIYQGEMISFEQLHNEIGNDAFNSLSSEEITNVLDENEITIGRKMEKEVDFFIERRFITDYAKMMAFDYQYGYDYVYNYETRKEHVANRTKNLTLEEFSKNYFQLDYEARSHVVEKVKENPEYKNSFYDLNNQNFHFMYKSSSDIIDLARKEKLIILSSEAGAGKTVAFERLTKDIKKLYPTHWVSYINLNDQIDVFTKYESVEIIENFLEDILKISSQKNEFEKKVFEESFKLNKTVLLWNGFDEISPTYNEYVLDFLKLIKDSTENVQFVCTRPLYADQLRNEFSTETWQLVPYNEDDKEMFLKKFYENINISSEIIEKNIKQIKGTIQKIEAVDKFFYSINTPLMLKLLAETYDNKTLSSPPNFYKMFDDFESKKISEIIGTNKLAAENVNKIIGSNIREVYQKYGIFDNINVFTTQTLAIKMGKLQIMQKDIPKPEFYGEISRLGILYINGKREFEFVHPTFSEFFLADYFIENIYKVKDLFLTDEEVEWILEDFFHLTKSYGSFQEIITDFMDSYLDGSNDTKYFHKRIAKILTTKFKKFFIRMLDINNSKIFDFLYKFFKKDHKVFIDLLQINKDETFYTAIFNPNYFALTTEPERILSLFKNSLTESEAENFIHGRNQKGKILLGMHFYSLLGISKIHNEYNEEYKMLKKGSYWNFIEEIRHNLTDNEKKELFITALSPKIYLFYDKIFNISEFYEYENLWMNFESLLSKSEMQDALGNALIQYFEIYAENKAGHEQFLEFFMMKINKFLSSTEIYEKFLNKNILHEAQSDLFSFTSLWYLISNHTSDEQKRTILMRDDMDDKNFYFHYLYKEPKKKYSSYTYYYTYYDFSPFKIFHRSLVRRSPMSFEFVNKIYGEYFNPSEIQGIILNSNDFLYYALGEMNKESFEMLMGYLEKLFEGKEKELIHYFNRDVEPTVSSVFKFIENFKGIPNSESRWFSNLEALTKLQAKLNSTLE